MLGSHESWNLSVECHEKNKTTLACGCICSLHKTTNIALLLWVKFKKKKGSNELFGG